MIVTIYVWIDALLNYITVLNLEQKALEQKRSQIFTERGLKGLLARLSARHGKRNQLFHVIWPALLLALELPSDRVMHTDFDWRRKK